MAIPAFTGIASAVVHPTAVSGTHHGTSNTSVAQSVSQSARGPGSNSRAAVGGGSIVVSAASYSTSSLDSWITQATDALAAAGYSPDQMNAADIKTIIMNESSGNPNAANYSDANAAAGTPSEGLMQVIDPTFQAYCLPGYNDIWNPVDNIIAGVRYAIDRYGSVSNVPGVVGINSGGSYVGY
jgi:soluble lytic murein transglycosylase-like protein